MRCCSVVSNLNDSLMHLLSEGQIKSFFFLLETQYLPDTAASTLLRYWNHAAFLCVNIWAELRKYSHTVT